MSSLAYQRVFGANNGAASGGGAIFTGGVITSPIKAAAGAVGAPSYSFSADTTSGVYQPSAGQLALSQNGVLALLFSGSQLATFGGSVDLPAAGYLQWGALSKLLAPSDGTVQITKSDGTFPTLLLGAAGNTTGIQVVASNGTLAVSAGAGGTAAISVAQVSCSSNVVSNNGNATNVGQQLGAGASAVLVSYTGTANLYYLRDGSGNAGKGFIVQGQYTIAKPANYPVTAGDSGTHFTNAGATGAITFTLPTASQGLRYRFTCTAAQALNVTAAANKLNAPNNTGKTTVTADGTVAANQFTSFDVVCYDGTNWVVQAVNGTVAYA